MSECLFCRIIKKEIPAKIVHEDTETLAFRDINPQAPTHILIVPKKHISQIDTIGSNDVLLVGKLHLTANQIAKKEGMKDFRLVINNGPSAGQSVFHIHLHLLAGRPFAWPPG